MIKTIGEINREDTKLLFHNSYWDGPLNGLMLWEGEKAWFEHTEDEEIIITQEQLQVLANEMKCTVDELEEEDKWMWPYRIYTVYRLPKDMLEAVEHNHKLFQDLVGDHCDYDKGRNNSGSTKPNSWQYYYSPPKWKFWIKDKTKLKKKYKLELSEYEILGKFKR